MSQDPMYLIQENNDGSWTGICRIQDGKEKFTEGSRQDAIHSMIQTARIMNGVYITEKNIHFLSLRSKIVKETSDEDQKLLDDLRRGEKVALDFNDPRIKYNLTKEELDLIIAIREGDAKVTWEGRK